MKNPTYGTRVFYVLSNGRAYQGFMKTLHDPKGMADNVLTILVSDELNAPYRPFRPYSWANAFSAKSDTPAVLHDSIDRAFDAAADGNNTKHVYL